MEASSLLTLKEVCKALKVSESTLKRLIREGEFHEPVYPTDGTAAWYEGDVTAYMWKRTQGHRLRKSDPKAKRPDDPLDEI